MLLEADRVYHWKHGWIPLDHAAAGDTESGISQSQFDGWLKTQGEKLTPEQDQALRSYLGLRYESINPLLRGEAPATDYVKEQISHLDSAFKSASSTNDQPITVFRAGAREGTDAAYVSTSWQWNADLQKEFGDPVKIHVPAGSKFLVSHRDRELLFPRGSHLRKNKDGSYDLIPNKPTKEAAVQQLRETAAISERAAQAAKTTGKMLVQFISPGWGSSGYYSPEVLQEAAANRMIPAGTHMYADHPTQDERNTRPERSIRDLMAVTTGDAQLAANGALVGEVRVMAPYQELLTDLKDHIGVSVFGDATDIYEGEAEGRRGKIVAGLAHISSVDFVTRPGRGGQVLELLESALADDEPLVEVIPDAWLLDGIHVELAEALRELVTSPAGAEGTAKLHAYWRHGEGAMKIRWGVAGDFQRCVDHLGKYVRDPKGYCAKMHKDVTGFVPGHAPGESHESDVPATRPDSTTTIEETTEVTMGKIQIEEADYDRIFEEAGRVDALTAERDTEKARADELAAKLAENVPTPTPPTGPAKRTSHAVVVEQLEEQKHEIAVLNARERARDIVAEEMTEAWVAPSTIARLTSTLLADLPLVEDKLDEVALRTSCVEARDRAEMEAAETLDAAGFGKPTGLGASTPPAGGDVSRYNDTIAENLQVFGLSEAEAAAATKGR